MAKREKVINNGMRDFFRMYSFMKPYMLKFIPGVIMYSSQGFIFPYISAIFMSGLTAAILAASVSELVYQALIFAGLSAAGMLIVAPCTYWYVVCEASAVRDLKARLFRSFVGKSLEASMSSHSGKGIAAINTDADTASHVYGNALTPFLACVISIVMSALVVFFVDYRLGLASVGIGALAFIAQYRFAGPLGRIGAQRLKANSDSVKGMSDILSGAIAIRAFNAQEKALISFDRESGKLRDLSFKSAFLSMWQDLFTSIQGWLTLIVVFALGGWLVATGRLSFPSLMIAPSMCMAIANGMSGIGGAWAELQAPVAAAARVFDILGGKEEGNTDITAAANRGSGYALKVNNLGFKYQGAESAALSGIDLEIKENEMVAFVGESGSGKSTLLRAVIGMYERDDFDIQFGGTRFSPSDLISWRGGFAYVDQSCKLFDMSIAENIALGAGGVELSREAVSAAAKEAFADGFISALPEGYDTRCGEKGASLSGGQKQRIAIARALARKAPVLVFDEATSALDTESEKQIMETIESLRKTHSILITTHNLNNIVNADKIVVMDKGRVAELGTHERLIAKSGLYARLFAQNTEKGGSK